MDKIKNLIRDGVGTKGAVGIEVEMEGRHINRNIGGFWNVEDDGSLGGPESAEYVLRKPLSLSNAKKALQELTEALKGSELLPSVRAGVHVHLNVQEYTLTQVANLVTLYLVVEDLLLEVCGEGRQSNLFCLKGCEAEYMVQKAIQLFQHGEVGHVNDDNIRYSGLNLAAIPKFGSVEFRAFRTPKDIMEIMPWVRTIHHLGTLAKDRYDNPIDVLTGYSEFDAGLFVNDVLPEYAAQLKELPNWEERLKRGMRSAQDLAYSQAWGVKRTVDTGELPESLQRLVDDHPHVDVEHLRTIWEGRNENT